MPLLDAAKPTVGRHSTYVLVAFAVSLALGAVAWAAPRPLEVRGNRLLDEAGVPVRLRGVNCAGLEWSAAGEGRIATTVATAVLGWHANIIRLPLSQDRWFGKAPEQTDEGAAYRALVTQSVEFCESHDAYLLLDLHWSDAGEWGRNIGQHNLPDRNSVTFWKDLAARFKDRPGVLFDLYNEPAHVNWDQWLRGGSVVEKIEHSEQSLTYEAVGMQALVDAIRATGARNVIVAGGVNWAYELEGIPGGRELADPRGRGVVYAVHPYPHAYEGLGLETIAQWVARTKVSARKLPVIVTEFGSFEASWPFPKEWNFNDEKWNRAMLATLEEQGWSWVAWDLHPSAGPCLIADWDYTPTPHFGVWVKRALEANLPRP